MRILKTLAGFTTDAVNMYVSLHSGPPITVIVILGAVRGAVFARRLGEKATRRAYVLHCHPIHYRLAIGLARRSLSVFSLPSAPPLLGDPGARGQRPPPYYRRGHRPPRG